MSDFHFEAKARIPCRPLSYTNRTLAEPKELIIDYQTAEIYISDENGTINNVTAFLLEELNKKLKENPEVVTQVTVTLPDGSTITIGDAIIKALTDIGDLQKVLRFVKNPDGSTKITISANDVETTTERNFVSQSDIDKWNKTSSEFNEKTLFGDGTPGLVPPAGPDDHNKYLKGDGTWGDPSVPVMQGATANANGVTGTVPAPNAGQQELFLSGSGQWKAPAQVSYSDMRGATSTSEGAAGLVPAPAAGQQDMFLKGNGQWATTPDTKYPLASKTQDGLLSKNDYEKLYNIQAGATSTPVAHITSNSYTINVGSNDVNRHVIAATDATTVSTMQTMLGRKEPVTSANTEYSNLMVRGEGLSKESNAPGVNGAIMWQYE